MSDVLIGRKCFDHFKTHDCNTENCATAKAFRQGSNVTAETVAKPGSKNLDLRYTSVPLKDDKGNIVAAFEMFVDETEVKSTMRLNQKLADYRQNQTEKIVTALQKLSEGDINFKITLDEADEDLIEAHDLFMQIVDAIHNTGGTVAALANDANTLAKAASEGQLDVRADASKHKGEYRTIIQGFNTTLDNLIRPVNVAAEYIDRISKGDIPPIITDEYKGDFNELKNNLNVLIDATNSVTEAAKQLSAGNPNITLVKRCKNDEMIEGVMSIAESIKQLANEMAKTTKEQLAGDIEAFADSSSFLGEYKTLIEGYNKGMSLHINAILGMLDLISDYSKGDLSNEMPALPGKQFIATERINKLRQNVINLITDTNMLSQAALKQDFDKRADASKHQGDFRKIVEGINLTLDTVVHKIFWFEQLLDAIQSPISVTDLEMNWTFINKAAEGIAGKKRNEVVGKHCSNWGADICGTEKCGVHGLKNGKPTSFFTQPGLDMDFRVDTSFILDSNGNKIGHIEVVSDVTDISNKAAFNKAGVDKLAENLDLLAQGNLNLDFSVTAANKYTREERENFLKINKNFEIARNAIVSLVQDTLMLSNAAENGKLDTRADSSKHLGDFKAIVDGVNKTLDNVIGPLNVAAEYVDRIAKGDLPPKISENYNGDFNEIKNNLNQCIDAVNLLVSDTKALAKSSVEGSLDVRANAERHQGDYRLIIEGLNQTLDAIVEPMTEAAETLSIMSTGDLTARMTGEYRGDYSKLQTSINILAESLNDLIAKILDGVETTASASIQISSTADTIATSSQEQSAQTEEVASAIEEMARTVTDNASNAQKTADVARQNREVAKEGGVIVEQTVGKMSDIAAVVKESAENIEKLGESSKQIGEIISVIDDIADQTNLLALNAAIEAARAGEQGRGFAVVADEVRKLAERTTEATKKIAQMIKGIQKDTDNAVRVMQNGNSEVSNGIHLADKAGLALKEIVISSQHLLDMISQIATANEEQAATGEEITKNVAMISEVTHDSSRRITEIAQSSDDLSRLTEDLKSLVTQFKINTSGFGIDPMESRKSLTSKSSKKYLSGSNSAW